MIKEGHNGNQEIERRGVEGNRCSYGQHLSMEEKISAPRR
jgi:hypothetical protein